MTKTRLMGCSAAALALWMTAVPVMAQQAMREFNIPAGDLGPALNAFALRADQEIVFSSGLVAGLRTAGVRGRYEPRAALTALLRGTGVEVASQTGAVITLRPASSPQADAGGRPDTEAAQLSEVVVTGSRIRGASPTAPVRVMTRADIDQSGYSQVGDLIRNLPENFGGGRNPGHIGVSASNENIANASTVNLRGLGDGATLVLLNGRRLVGDATGQSPDISGIPLASLARVEVLKDGSSALYGSDAVAGVVNFITRRDYDGGEVSARLGGATDGGAFEQTYSALGGVARDDWYGLFNVEYSTQDGIRVTDREYTASAPPENFLLRPQERTSALLTAGRRINDRISLSLDALWSDHTSEDLQQYSADWAATEISTDSQAHSITAGAALALVHDWRLQLNATTAQSVIDYTLGDGTYEERSKYRNELNAVEAVLDGAVFTLPGGEVQAVIGGGWRDDEYALTGTSSGGNGSHEVGSLFGELRIPLVAADSGRTGLNSLELSLSGRYEDYSDFGETSTPKIGLRYVPLPGLTLRSTWGKSFKAPTFQQIAQPRTVIIYPAEIFGLASGGVFYVTGGSEDLQPERSTSWTVGADYSPAQWSSLTLSATYFAIDYTDRVVTPIYAPIMAMSDPAFAPFVLLNPTAEQQAAFLNTASQVYNDTGSPYDPASVVGVIANTFANAASQKIHGVDLAYRQAFNLGRGSLQAFADLSWISIDQQVLPRAPVAALAGIIGNVPEFRGRAGATWTLNTVSVTAAVNHQNRSIDNGVTPSRPIDTSTTVDAKIVYSFPDDSGPVAGVDLSLAATNLFNEAPPYAESPSFFLPGITFDSVNASAVGRFVSVTMRKRF